MSIIERIAELPPPWVAVIVAALWLGRYILRKRPHPAAKTAAELCESLAIAGALVFFIIRPFIVQAFFIPSESMVPTLLVHDHILVNKLVYRVGQPKRGDIIVFKAPKRASADEKEFIKRVIAVPGDVVKIKPGHVLVGGRSYSHADLALELSSLSVGEGQPTVKLVEGQILVNGRAVSSEQLAAAVGHPKAKVEVFPGTVIVNGKGLREPYIAEDPGDRYPGGSGNYVDKAWVVTDSEHAQAVKVPRGKLFVLGDNRNCSMDARYWGLLDRSRVLGKAMFSFWPLGRMGVVR